jgi:hypothetical protein
MRSRQLWIVMLLATGSVCLQAQWLNHPAPGTPRAKDGKPNLRAAAPRSADGRPDLSGVWVAEPAPLEERLKIFPDSENGTPSLGEPPASRYFGNVLADFKPDEVTMKPWAEPLFKERGSTNGKDVPSAKCLPLGLPLMDTALFLTNRPDTPVDRRALRGSDRVPPDLPTAGNCLWIRNRLCSGIRWDGGKDWLVVEVAGFTDRGWLDVFGHPFSDAMRLTERFHRRDFGHMDVQVTIGDPKTYSRPFTFKFTNCCCRTPTPRIVLRERKGRAAPARLSTKPLEAGFDPPPSSCCWARAPRLSGSCRSASIRWRSTRSRSACS